MAEPDQRRRLALRLAQALLMLAAGSLWAASRLPWVDIRSFDGLGQPKEVTLSGASWSTALLPLAVLSLAAAVAAVAVRGWTLRVLASLMALASAAAGYLAISMWAGGDVAARGAEIAGVPVAALVGSGRHYLGAAVTLAGALCVLAGAALLMRSASSGDTRAKYVPPAARRAMTRSADSGPQGPQMSERMIWDALDEGQDPTERAPGPDAEGR